MFKPGLEDFFAADHQPTPKQIAVVTNFTGRDSQGVHLLQRLIDDGRFKVKRIFTPEHGFNSDAPDGEHVVDSRDSTTGIEIVSLYGPQKSPAKEMLKDLDLLIYDMQDLGVRFYTYISTLRNIIDAAAENGVPVAVLDRPDPLGGSIVEGPMLKPEFSSFVSHIPVPLRYGLTPGELALWWKDNREYDLEIKVYRCQDYKCPASYESLKFPWYKPSPSMPDVKTAIFYPGTCLFEGTELSEGRGTDAPFRKLGAPWIKPERWLEALLPLLPQNVTARSSNFTPTFSKWTGEKCNGIELLSEASTLESAVFIGIACLFSLMVSHPDSILFSGRPGLKYPFIDYLAGTDRLRKGLLEKENPRDLANEFNAETRDFFEQRKVFFLYPR